MHGCPLHIFTTFLEFMFLGNKIVPIHTLYF
jgi:hypothetical protein